MLVKNILSILKSPYYYILILVIFQVSTALSQTKKEKLENVLVDFEILQLETNDLFESCKAAKDTINLKLLGWDLKIQRNNLLSGDYSVITKDENGIVQIVNIPKPVTLSGTTSKGGKVSMTVTENSIQGYISNGMFTFYFEPVSHFDYKGSDGNIVLYNTKDIIEGQERSCGVTGQHKVRQDIESSSSKREVFMGCREVQYAIASDYSMFQHYGSFEAVANHNIAVTNDMMTNYDNEFNDEIRFVVVQQHIVTNSGSNICSDSATWNYMLNCFTSWAPTGFTSTHDLGTLWTRRTTSGSTVGIAWVGTVCTNLRYNVMKDFTNNANAKRATLAHEIGHNFNADHDASGSITIMAPSLNQNIIINNWSTLSINTINSYYVNRPCLGNCTPQTPLINFADTLVSVSEIGSENNGQYCGSSFKTVLIPVALDRATALATNVSVEILGTSTATNGLDFELLTSSLVFPAGSGGTQSIELRIIDDAIEEGIENIILQITTVSGPGVIGEHNICTIQIMDNKDYASQTCCSPSGFKQYGNSGFELIFIFNSDYADSRNRFLYLPTQLNAANITSGFINGISFFVTTKNSTQSYYNFRLGIQSVNFNSLLNQEWISTTTVHISDFSTVAGQWQTINFDEPYFWDGTSSLYIETCFNNSSSSISTDYIFGGFPIGGGSDNYYDIRTGSTTDCILGDTTVFYDVPNLQPYFRFHLLDSVQVENTINTSSNSLIAIGEKANLYSEDQKIIASIKNQGSSNLNCLSASIVTTGNNMLAMAGGGNYAQKTFEITADNTSTFELTLYYTPAQLSTFGLNADKLNIVQSQVPFNVATINDLTIVRPDTVLINFGKDKAYVYKASFNGFSYFSLTDQTLPAASEVSLGDLVISGNQSGLVLRNSEQEYYKLTVDDPGNILINSDLGTNNKVTFPAKDLSFTSTTGLILKSPNNSFRKLQITNAGVLSTTSVPSLPITRIENQSGNIQLEEVGSAIILKSPNGNCWRVFVNANGELRSVKIICP
jgi:hypothetical protein